MAALTRPDANQESNCKRWVRYIINDGVEASGRKYQALFQIIQVSASAEPRMRLEQPKNLPEISLSRPDPQRHFA